MTLIATIGNNGIEETEGVNGVKAITLNETGNMIESEITGGGGTGWQPPSDWIDISEVNDNEINLLVSDKCVGYAFSVTTQSGTYTIDWGDGNIETSRVSGTTYKHQYAIDGTPCSEGYGTFKIRIYGASSNITKFQIKEHNYNYSSVSEVHSILWAVFGTAYITDYSNAFSSSSGDTVYCYKLQCVDIRVMNAATPILMASILSNARSLRYLILPANVNNITDLSDAFTSVMMMTGFTFPNTTDSLSNLRSTFNGCSGITTVRLPASWGVINNCANTFNGSGVDTVILPADQGDVPECSGMFSGSKIRNIENLQYLGSLTQQCNMSNIFNNCYILDGEIIITSLLSSFGMYSGASSRIILVSSLRLTNPGSTFTGSSPQVNVQYCSMNATALNTLFGDLPTLTGKTIRITGNPGAGSCNTSIATAKGWTVL